MKTIHCIFSTAACYLVTLSLATAKPISNVTEVSSTTETSSTESSSTPALPSNPVVGHLNGSKLVITHVIKTLEFEVDLEEDDGNSTESNIMESDASTPVIVSDIELLNPKLLEEVVQESKSTETPLKSIDGTKFHDEDGD